MVQAGAVPTTWIGVMSEWQRDWAREATVPAVAEVSVAHSGATGVAYLWEMSRLLTMPTLLMVGKTSNVLDEETVEKMLAAMPASSVRWFDTGHYVPRERPDEFTGVLLEFLTAD